MSVKHNTIVIERKFNADVKSTFATWRETKALAKWYLPGDATWSSQFHEHDFRVGGRKHLSFGPKGEEPYSEDCRYEDIIENERIVFTMTVLQRSKALSASLITAEFASVGSQTQITMTEQMAALDGLDSSDERTAGWHEVFDRLGPFLTAA